MAVQRSFRVLGICLAVSVLVAACASGRTAAPNTSTTAEPPAVSSAPTAVPSPSRTWVSDEDFDPDNFSNSAAITNPYFPMAPGTKYRWEGQAFDEGDKVTRAIEFTVTNLTKEINGVVTRVARDIDITDGDAEELELTFYAQDDFGTVWYFGEYSEEYDDARIVKSPTWLAGLRGARAGIMMPAEPRTGTPDYAEGWGGTDVEWTDRGKVDKVRVKDCVPTGCYTDVTVIDEFNPDEPETHQLKYYAPNVGGIRTGWRGKKEAEKEELQLVSRKNLSERALADLHDEVLAQEKRAYHRSPKAYAKTPPMKRS